MEFLINKADTVKVGDFIITAVSNALFPRDVHLMGKVLEISNPHPEITEFLVSVFAHCDGRTGEQRVGLMHDRLVGIIRNED